MVLFVIKCVNAPCAAVVIIFGIAGYAAALPKGHTKQRAISVIPYYKKGKNKVNTRGFNCFHFSSVSYGE